MKFKPLRPILTILLFAFVTNAQSPTPTPERGIGIQSSTSTATSQADQRAKEAKPELVLQTGYNDLFGATRLVFSPDGRLLATGTFRSSTIKIWETATSRKLRDISTGTQGGNGLTPMVVFSRDSKYIAVAAGDNSVKVWDVANGREVQTLSGPQGTVMAAAGVFFLGFTSDNRLVTVSDAVRVWDISSGRELRTISANAMSSFNGTDSGITLSPDGNQILITEGGPDTEIRSFDLTSGKEGNKIKLPGDQIDSLQLTFTSDGHLLAAGLEEKRFKLWDLTAKSTKELATASKDYSQFKFSRDGRFVLLTDNYTVRVWEVATLKEQPAIKVPNTGIFTQVDVFASFSDDGKKIATGGFDTDIITWETETAKQLSKMTGRTNMAYNVMFSADGTHLSVGGRTRWDLRTGRGLRVGPANTEKSYPIQSPDGRLLAVMRLNNPNLAIIESATGKQLHELKGPVGAMVMPEIRFSSDSSMISLIYGPPADRSGHTNVKSSIVVWDTKTGNQLSSITTGDSPVDTAFSADNRSLAIIGTTGEIATWNVQSGSKLVSFSSSPMKSINDMINAQMSGRRPTSMPNMAEIGEMMTNMMGGMSAGTMGRKVTSVAFSPDGRILATGGFASKSNIDLTGMMRGGGNQKPQKNQKQRDPDDMMRDIKIETIGQAQLWDVTTGQEIAALKGHGRGVLKIAFSRDGKLFATASTDNTIKIWDIASRRELKTLAGHSASVDSISFSPDSRLLASATDDGATLLWDANTGEHLLTLISLDDGGEWMVVNPQGLFDGTPLTWNQILWRYNQETFNVAPIEWFFNEFYYPGLLADVFSGKRPKVAEDISRKDRRQPIVKLSVGGETPATGIATRTVKVKLEITDAPADKDNPKGTGARDVRLFRNGSLVKVWRGDVLNGKPSVTLEHEMTATAGPNRLVAYAFNNDNVKSKDAPLVFTGAQSLKRKGVAYIIAVGVNEYANKDYNLRYAVADAQSFGDEVRSRQNQIGDFERIEVVSLLNENATKANILAALKKLNGETSGAPSLKANPWDNLKKVEPEDTVIIYYAGHGTAQAQRFYLIPHDLGYTGDRTKLTEQGLKTILDHSISDLELEAAVEGLDAGHLLLVIDACNSGQALEAEEKRRGPMNSKGLAQLAYEKGMYILTAAQSFQAALEAAQLGHGLLTYALVEEGLKTPVADDQPKDGVLIAREWLDFATERVPQMQEMKMKEGRGVGISIAFTEGEANIADPQQRSIQRPRVFYRREMEANPLVIAKP